MGAAEPAGDAGGERVLVDAQLDHMVQRHALVREQHVERLGLALRARVAVEDEAGAHVRFVQPFR